jgi:membrane protease YdiL (CAAX protease family)
VATEQERGEAVRRAIVIAIWLGAALALGPLGNRLVPDDVKVKVAYQTFQMACQILSLVIGLGAALLLLRRPREALGLSLLPGPAKLASTVAAAPIVFVVSCYVALQIALPTLLEELKTRGANASQQNAGAFGRALTQSPLLVTLLWGALLAGLGEELFFRGLFWSTITGVTSRLRAPRESGPGDPPPTVGERALAIALHGGIATVLSAALFGYMHKDLPGGVGIVRFWSTTLLGLASGVVRQATGGVVACILLHTVYNTIVIGAGQRWFSSAKEQPILEGVPNTLLLLALVGALALGVIAFVRALHARRARSAFVPD